MKVQKFWMVHGIGQRSPTFRHKTRLGAQEEAKRLAREIPGAVFVVLAARDAYCAAINPVDRVEVTKREEANSVAPDPDIPF